MGSIALVSTALRGEDRAWKHLAATRGQQVVGLLLATIPVAERMLLYQAAMTAWLMLPDRGLVGKTILSSFARLGLSR
jgi:hypothetical protein